MTLQEYLMNLNQKDLETLRLWMQDPCYPCPIEFANMARRFEKAFEKYGGGPMAIAALADLEDRVSELGAAIERIVTMNNLRNGLDNECLEEE